MLESAGSISIPQLKERFSLEMAHDYVVEKDFARSQSGAAYARYRYYSANQLYTVIR